MLLCSLPGEQTRYAAPEDRALAKFDKVLDQYQQQAMQDSNTDYYGSTVTNSSVSSLTVGTMQPPVTSAEIATAAASKQLTNIEEQIAAKNHNHNQQQQQLPPSGTSVVRRPSRGSHTAASKKSRSQRRTLGASQMAEAAHELSLAAAAAAASTAATASANSNLQGAASGCSGLDTWPRYRPPHQLLSSILPAFYRTHGERLEEIYSKQGAVAAALAAVNSTNTAFQQQQQLPNEQYLDDGHLGDYHHTHHHQHLNYLTNIHQPRRKLRKSLGANFNDLFYNGSATTPSASSAAVAETSERSELGVPNSDVGSETPANNSSAVNRWSPRITTSTDRESSGYQLDQLNAADYGVIGIPFENHQMVYHSQSVSFFFFFLLL